MKVSRFVYALCDPAVPQTLRYVGRTNDLDTRLRTHIHEAEHGLAIKDVWLMYLRYAGRAPGLRVIEECQAGEEKQADHLVKQREIHWIRRFAVERTFVNGPYWANHPSRKSIPAKIKEAWCWAHVLLWSIDRDWLNEKRFLEHLHSTHGLVIRTEPGSRGAVPVECMGDVALAKSLFEQRRHRTWSMLKCLADAHPALLIDDLGALRDRLDGVPDAV